MKLELKLEKSQKKIFLMNKKFQPIIFSLLLIIGIFLGKQLNKNDNISTNDKINSIINLINTNYVDSINENFEENIKSRYRDDFTYESFSEGEKMRIDLALLFTWRAVAKMKNSTNTNLLILDEIFDSSLDGTGTDEFLKILNTLGDENVFVISHKQDALADKFRSTIRFEKVKNFSHISE